MQKSGIASKILVAVDGSEDSYRAARMASKLAKAEGAELLIVTVMTLPEYMILEGNMSGALLDEIYEDSSKRAEQVVDKAMSIASEEGVKAKGKVVRDSRSVVQSIVEYAKKEGVDMIVVGTRGLSGFKRLLLGSVSSGVASHAHCSVLIVRQPG